MMWRASVRAERGTLIKHFGSVKRMREASVEDLGEVVPAGIAVDLYSALSIVVE